MKKVYLEILVSILFVVLCTIFVYNSLEGSFVFLKFQSFWSVVLSVGWVIVSLGYYHQGWIVHKSKSAEHVSIVLPVAVFVVQCVLFIKGIYYHDWSLIAGALVVNSGVVFSLYHIIRARKTPQAL